MLNALQLFQGYLDSDANRAMGAEKLAMARRAEEQQNQLMQYKIAQSERERAKEEQRRNALSGLAGRDPRQIENALYGIDPELAIKMRAQNQSGEIARQKMAWEQQKANQPIWDSDRGVFIQRPGTGMPTGAPGGGVGMPGYPGAPGGAGGVPGAIPGVMVGGGGLGPKAPPGYRATPSGDLEPIPGTKDWYKRQELQEKERKQAETALAAADLVMEKADKAISQINPYSTGFRGQMLKGIGGSGAFDLDKTLDTIRAKIGFNELQAMRAASPTGGALGQVAVRELEMLQAVLGSLDQAQSPEQLRESLQAIKTHYGNWKKTVEQARRGGQGAAPGAAPSVNDPLGIRK